MKILFLTDSLSLPRKNSETDFVNYEQTYIHKLRTLFKDYLIVDCAIGGALISQLNSQCFYYKSFEPDIVIIQSGIVDCCPRPYGKFVSKVLNKIGLRTKLKKVNFLLRKYRNYTFTNKIKFRSNLLAMKDLFPNSSFYSIVIINGVDAYEKIVPGIKRNINIYNDILKRNTEFIDTVPLGDESIMRDFHHLNSVGHDKLFSLLKMKIEDYVKEKK